MLAIRSVPDTEEIAEIDEDIDLGPPEGFEVVLFERPYGMAYLEFLVVDANAGFSARRGGVKAGHLIIGWSYDEDGERKTFDAKELGYTNYLQMVSDCPLPLYLKIKPGLSRIEMLSPQMRDWDPFAELLFIRYGFYEQPCSDASPQEKLVYSCKVGSLVDLEEAVREGAHIELPNNVQRSAIHYATMYGHVDCVKFLIEHKANLNCRDQRGQTPVSWACCNGKDDCLQLLLDAGADCTIVDIFGQTPLHYACGQYFLSCTKLILQAVPHIINSRDDLGITAIWKCSNDGFLDGLSYLYDHGGDLRMSSFLNDQFPKDVARDDITSLLVEALETFEELEDEKDLLFEEEKQDLAMLVQ